MNESIDKKSHIEMIEENKNKFKKNFLKIFLIFFKIF